MEKNEFVEVISVFAKDILADNSVVISEDTTPEDVDGWDSVSHVNLVSALEDKYGIKLSLREMMSWETIGDLADIIMNKVQDA